jgi:hypothetical protein
VSGGAQRAAMALDAYDRDPESNRLFRLLADLADYCHEAGFRPVSAIAASAEHAAAHRRR